jgi:hypothetical protein
MSGLLAYSYSDDFSEEVQRKIKDWIVSRMKETSGDENIEDLFLDYIVTLIGTLLTHSLTHSLTHIT